MKRLVVFDLDCTLLDGDSDEYWLRFLIDKGVVDHGEIELRNNDIQTRYANGVASAEEFCLFYLSLLRGHARADLDRWRGEFMRAFILPNLPQAARDLVRNARPGADLLVMSTATNRFLADPIARHLEFEHLIATEPEENADGTFSGGCAGLPNMRANKVTRLDTWLREQGRRLADFDESWFYSDSRNDLPLLSCVTHPVVVDPDRALAEHARARGWPVLHLHASRQRPPASPAGPAGDRDEPGKVAAPQA